MIGMSELMIGVAGIPSVADLAANAPSQRGLRTSGCQVRIRHTEPRREADSMEREDTNSVRNDSYQRSSLTEAEVLELLAEAEADYDAYVALSKLSAYRVPAGKIYEPKYDWSTPMTLVIY